MLMEKEREMLPFKTQDLFDKSRKAYQNKTDLPCITFWGMEKILCDCEVFSPNWRMEFKVQGNIARLNFLKEVFGGTNVDPEALIFRMHQRKTRDNYLTKVWHLTWKYDKPTKWVYGMTEAFQQAPRQTLDGVRRKLERMFLEESFSQELYEKIICELFYFLYPNRFGSVQQDAGRFLTILLVICLLGEDIVLASGLNDTIHNWLNGVDALSAPMVWKPLKSTGIYRVEDEQIDVDLLPNIVCEEVTYSYNNQQGSPLRQIIQEHTND